MNMIFSTLTDNVYTLLLDPLLENHQLFLSLLKISQYKIVYYYECRN